MKFLSNLKDWLTSASYSDSSVTAWLAGLIVVLILAFLWSTVVRKIVATPVKVAKDTVSEQVMPKALERKLFHEAKEKHFGKKRTNAFVYGTLRKIGWTPKKKQHRRRTL